jgi:hypothetical protein
VVVNEQHQQRNLLVGAWRHAALRRLKADIARNLAAPEKIQHWSAKTRIWHVSGCFGLFE